MAFTLSYGTVFTPREVIERASVVVSDEGRIVYVGPMEHAPHVDGQRLDMRGRIVVPGFIDVHVHGGNGITFGGSADAATEVRDYSQWIARFGVTGFLCSIASPNAQAHVEMAKAFCAAFEVGASGAEPLGLHLEGPFINVEKKGAFNPAWIRQPDLAESRAVLEAGQRWIRQITMAPEMPGAREVSALFRAAGVVVSMGHTNTDFDAASAALKHNFTHVTHTFNAQSGFSQRAPGVFGAVLSSNGVTAEMIGDGVHVHQGAMTVLLRCLGTERVVLITDAMAGAGLSDGQYDLVGHEVTVKDGRATLADGTLAGSTAVMNQCVRNVLQQTGVTLMEAVKMASLNPARAMGFSDRLGSIAVGKDASLTVIDEDVNVYLTVVKGKIVYQNW
jgi:N-acetylglucosamine-6-phosphate deacetylase